MTRFGEKMKPPPADPLRVQREREFSAHHMMLDTAFAALEAAEKKIDGWLYPELVALTFSALAVEAFANAFGAAVVPRWEEFESSSPLAKIRTVALQLGIEEGQFPGQKAANDTLRLLCEKVSANKL